MPRRGRRPADTHTTSARVAILDAARELFGERGYDRATIRAIADRAGVDPALVHHYYGTKEDLLVSALELPIEFDRIEHDLRAAGREHAGEALVRFFLTQAAEPLRRGQIVALLRSATSSDVAARLLRGLVSRVIVGHIAAALGEVPDIELRAELAASHLIGMGIARYVVAVEPLASTPDDTIVAAVGPAVQRYLTGDLWADGAGPVDPHRR